MKGWLTFCFALGCVGLARAETCSIVDQRRITLGVDRGMEGRCSNNGERVTCTFHEGEGINCQGPEGSYTGDDLSTLIFSACGCDSQRQEERGLESRLNDDPTAP